MDDIIPDVIGAVIGIVIAVIVIRVVLYFLQEFELAAGTIMHRNFQGLGQLQGLHIATIIAAAGQPNSRTALADGRVVCQWMCPGYHIALVFTGNICDGVTHEYAA